MSILSNTSGFVSQLFPPTPTALRSLQSGFRTIPFLSVALWFIQEWIPFGKNSITSKYFNLPGRYAWSIAESVGPVNLIYILYSLPTKLPPLSNTMTTVSPRTGLFGTGLPITHEIMGLLYVLHYINRAGFTPLYMAPSISPIHAVVSVAMIVFQFVNSSSIAGWICYDAQRQAANLSSAKVDARLISFLSVLGMICFIGGLAGNVSAEWRLFELRRGAAKRKAKSEGKAVVTYDKVYIIPESQGLFKYIMFPHYTCEWLEWTGYWILGGAWGLGWSWQVSAALMFLANEVVTMAPRAYTGVGWYEKKFGKRAVAGRKAVIPFVL